jgi:hypothetical protein
VITAWILLSPVLADTVSDTASNVSRSPPSLDDHGQLDGQLDVPVVAALMLAFTSDGHLDDVWITIDELIFVDGERRGDEYLWTAVLTIDHEPSDRDLSLVHLSGGESIADSHGAEFARADGVLTVEVPFRTTAVDGEVCFQAIQEVEAGRSGDASDAACEQLPRVSLSCSSASTRPASMALLLLPLLAAGRRRC